MTQPTPSSAPSRILVVDDEPFMQMQIRLFLQREGYEIWGAANGKEALALYQDYQPDLVLLDALMPVMDGFECCRQLTQGNDPFATPVLMITGLEDEQSVNSAFEAGATDYITKPIPWAVLRQRVKRLLFQSRLQRELKQANQQLQQLALMDSLTQIFNRRYFDQHFDYEWHRCRREKEPLALILVDVDYFKRYNDLYGHPLGDLCLKRIAKALELSITRATDFVARYGGEEFALVLPNTEWTGAVAIGLRILDNVHRLSIPLTGLVPPSQERPLDQPATQITVSLGLAVQVPQQEQAPQQLLNQADRCLYEAKRQGRDRLVHQQEGQWVSRQWPKSAS